MPDKTFWQKTLDDPITFYTLTLAIFSGALLVVSAIQIRFLIRADTTSRLAAEASKRAAEAAETTANAALGMELPRLEIDYAGINLAGPDQDALRVGAFEIQLRNFGRTPGHIVEDCLVAAVTHSLPTEPRYPFNNTQDAAMGSVVEGGEKHTINGRGRIMIDEAGARDVVQGRQALWLYGFICYRDFLGGHWRSKFCLRFRPGRPGTQSLFEQFSAHPRYIGRERYDPFLLAAPAEEDERPLWGWPQDNRRGPTSP